MGSSSLGTAAPWGRGVLFSSDAHLSEPWAFFWIVGLEGGVVVWFFSSSSLETSEKGKFCLM